ncbi:hypothetical protein BT69DRAFT_1255379 [Atractiella rhizophila]|nr:hypothetical protein BT69DRAFT_1255379 [Atractiella rhizophila]
MDPVNKIALSASSFPVTHVTLYPSRAEVRRTVTAELKEGENEVVLSDLPTDVVHESLRVEGSSTFETILKHVSLTTSPRPVLPTPVTQKTKELAEERRTLEAEKDRIGKRSRMLDTYMSKVDPEHVSVEQLESIIDFHSNKAPDMGQSIHQLTERIKEIDHAISVERERVMNEERDKLEGKNESLRSKAVVGVFASAEGETELTITYAVHGASWRPLFDARIKTVVTKESGEKPVALAYKANISQQTGEDWNAVQLTLSTSHPTTSTDVPTLPPWTIHFQRPSPPVPVAMPAPVSRSAGFSPNFGGILERGERLDSLAGASSHLSLQADEFRRSASFASKKKKKTVNVAAVTTQGSMSATFDVPGRTTVLSASGTSDEQEEGKTVTIAELNLPATLEWIAVPKVVEKVYLNSKVKNKSDYQLLAGPVAVYLDGSFVANAHLRDVSVNEEFPINLGVDPSIRVTYNPRSIRSSTSGLLSRTKSHLFTQRMVVHNSKASRITMVLKDQIPISQDSNLVVKLISPSLSTAEEDKGKWSDCGKNVYARWSVEEGSGEKKPGEVEWKIEVQPGQKTAVGYEFEVTAGTGDPRIVGLDRVS